MFSEFSNTMKRPVLFLALACAACSNNDNNPIVDTTGDAGGQCMAPGTLAVTSQGAAAYVINGSANPTLTLCRGDTYTFSIKASGHPFYIKTVQGTGTDNAYTDGVTGNGADMGNVTFVVPMSAPSTLYYDCSIHAPMKGTIHVID